MYLFTDETETKFYIHNHFGRGLHRIEVNTVSDVLDKYKICKGLALLDYHFITGGFSVPLRVTGEPKSKPFRFDFLKGESYAQITSLVLDTLAFDAQLVLINKLSLAKDCDASSSYNPESSVDHKCLWSNHDEALNITVNTLERTMSYQVVDNPNPTNYEG